MSLKNFLRKYNRLIICGAIFGGILGAVFLGVLGFQYGVQQFFIKQIHVGDLRPEEYAYMYVLQYGFLGCLSGIFIAPLTIVIGYILVHTMRRWINPNV
jgi:hypothetical protein